jgi:hypothetical protein
MVSQYRNKPKPRGRKYIPKGKGKLHSLEEEQEEPPEGEEQNQDPEADQNEEGECEGGEEEDEECSDEELDDPNGTILAFRKFMTRSGRCYRCHQPGHYAAKCPRFTRSGSKKFPPKKIFSGRYPSPQRGYPSKQTGPSWQTAGASSSSSKSNYPKLSSPQRYQSPSKKTSTYSKPQSPTGKGNVRGGQ